MEGIKMYCDTIEKHIKQIFDNAKVLDLEELQDESIYKNMMADVCKVEMEYEAGTKILAKHSKANHTSLAVFDEALANDIEKKKVDPMKSKRYKNFVQSLEAQPSASQSLIEEGLATAADMISTVDPFTKRQIDHPVRNKYCNHIYDKDTIIELIKTQGRQRCPTVGCSNRREIKESDLVEDSMLIDTFRRLQTN